MAQLTGKVTRILDKVSGETANGGWVRAGFVVESQGDNARTVAFTAFGDRKAQLVRSLRPGQLVVVNYYPESREFNERFYTDLMVQTIMLAQSATVAQGGVQ